MTWLYVPSICATEEAAGSSLSGSPASTYEPWLELSGKPSRRPLSWRGWRTRPWIQLLCGTISQPSTAARGVATWISSLPASPVNRSRRRAPSWELRTTATSGPLHIGSSLTFDLESYSWRTAPSLFESDGSTTSSGILPHSGSMRSGVCSQRKALGPLTNAVGSGCWPTPTWKDSERSGSIGVESRGLTLTDMAERMWITPVAQDDNKSVEAHLAMKERMGGGRKEVTSLNVQTKMWQTPTVAETMGGHLTRSGDRGDELLLRGQAKEWQNLWPTPRASENENRTATHQPSVEDGHGRSLSAEARLWPTPKASEFARGSDPDRGPEGGSPGLRRAVEHWPTPAAHNAKNDAPGQLKRNTPGLPTVASRHSPTTGTVGSNGSPQADLNPAFVEALMGLPAGWSDPSTSVTGFGCWVTAWSSHVRRLLSGSWLRGR